MQIKLTAGQRYAALRHLTGLSQKAVSKSLNRSISWCAQLELDRFALSVEQAIKLAKLYNVTIGQLIGLEQIEITILAETTILAE